MNDPTISALIVGFILTQLGFWADGRRQSAKLRADHRRQSKKTDEKIDVAASNADTAVTAAKLAAKRSEPTANGFADEVRGGLTDIKESQEDIKEDLREVNRKIDRHLADHASADVLRKKEEK